jgi:hypothetical protein
MRMRMRMREVLSELGVEDRFNKVDFLVLLEIPSALDISYIGVHDFRRREYSRVA